MAEGQVGYVHSPLHNPQTDIRLLFLEPGSFDEPIVGSLTAWTFAEAPSYVAISYTWGNSTDLEPITLNHQPFLVRSNCLYALRQARGNHGRTHIWIDSICIDQKNLAEKGHQVGIMSNIYVSAFLVLACIGKHDSDSLIIQDVLDIVEPIRDLRVQRDPWTDEDRDRWGKWMQTKSPMYQQRLCRSYALFIRRPFFTRVWIVQELVGGGDGIRLLCGTQILSWYRLRELATLLLYHWEKGVQPFRQYSLESFPIMDLWELSMAYKKVPLELVLYRTRSLECTNILDRIYGVMRLVDWPAGSPPLVPDYTYSRVELAAEVIARCPPYLSMLGDLLHALRLDRIFSQEETTRDRDDANILQQLVPTSTWRMNVLYAYAVRQDRDGRLYVDFEPPQQQAVGGRRNQIALSTRDIKYTTIYARCHPWAAACIDIRPGDIIVASTIQDLVLREQQDGTLVVVGPAMAPVHWNLDDEPEQKSCSCFNGIKTTLWGDVHLQLRASIGDAVKLAHRTTTDPKFDVLQQVDDTVLKQGLQMTAVTMEEGVRVSLLHLLEHG